jgi:ABC-type transporter Mla subunit MlaD
MSAHRRPRRRRRPRAPALLIAAAVTAGIAAVTYVAFNRGLPFTHQWTASAIVSDSVNVRPGDPVRIAGIDVGSVSSVTPTGEASRITFNVEPAGRPLHRDATLHIRPRLFLEGSYYLALDPGTPSAPTLDAGATIPESQTASPVQFYKVLSTFDVATRTSLHSLTAQLARALGGPRGAPWAATGAAGLKATFPPAAPALRDTAVIARALRGTAPGDVHRLLTSASAVTGTLGASAVQLAGLVTGLDRVSSALVASDGALGASLRGVDATLQAAPGPLRAVDRALDPVAQLTRALDPSLRAAPPLVRHLTTAAGQLATALAPARRAGLLAALRTTFENLPVVLTQLGKAFPVAKQVTDCLRTHVTPVLTQQVPDGTLSSGRPVWQDFVHFLPGVGAASANFDANGPFTRVLAAAGTQSLSLGTIGGIDSILKGLPVIGNLPVVGKLLGTAPPGGSAVLGSRPAWVGDPTAADFRPDVPCASQPVPSLGSTTVSSNARTVRTRAAKPVTRAQLRAQER